MAEHPHHCRTIIETDWQSIFNRLTEIARRMGYQTMSLVAVQQAASFWTKMGFSPSMRVALNDSYTGDATFMTRDL